jgi:branched-subunit amino acid permease
LVLSSGIDGALIRDVLVGIGVLFVGIGILVVCLAVARLVRRMNGTLDEVDRQIGALSAPVVETLGHVGGIADSADAAVAKLGTVVGALEVVADGVGSTAKLATDAVAPAVVNLGAILAGLTAGLRRLVGVPGPSAPSAPNGETALHG